MGLLSEMITEIENDVGDQNSTGWENSSFISWANTAIDIVQKTLAQVNSALAEKKSSAVEMVATQAAYNLPSDFGSVLFNPDKSLYYLDSETGHIVWIPLISEEREIELTGSVDARPAYYRIGASTFTLTPAPDADYGDMYLRYKYLPARITAVGDTIPFGTLFWEPIKALLKEAALRQKEFDTAIEINMINALKGATLNLAMGRGDCPQMQVKGIGFFRGYRG